MTTACAMADPLRRLDCASMVGRGRRKYALRPHPKGDCTMSDSPSIPAEPPSDTGIVTKSAPGTVAATVARLTELATARHMKVFAVIDHSGEAEREGLELPDTKLVIFG